MNSKLFQQSKEPKIRPGKFLTEAREKYITITIFKIKIKIKISSNRIHSHIKIM
jgi:hypothetical protein